MDILPKKIRSRLLVWSIENLKIYSVDGDEALNRNCLDIVNFIATKLHRFIESNPSTNGQTSVKISANAGGALLDDLKQCLQHVIFLIKQHLRNVSHASCKALDGMAALWSAYFDILFVKSQRFPVDETETTNGIGSCVYSLNGSVDHVMDVFLQCEYSDVPTAYEIIAMFIGKLRDMLKSDKDKALKMGSFVRGVLVYHQAGRVIGCGRKVEKSLKKILLKRCHSPWETLNLIQAHSGGLLSMDDIPNDAEKSRLNILFDHSTMTKEKCDCLLEAVAGLTSIVTDQSISPESVDVIETIDIENEESENTTIPGIYALTDKNMEMEVELAETESCETDGQPIAEDTSDSASIPTFVSFEPQSTKSPEKLASATESVKSASVTESTKSPGKSATATETAESPKKAANATESTKSPKKLGNSIESSNSTSTGQMETVQSETNGPDDSANQQSSSLNDIIVDEVQFTEVCPAWRRLRSNSNINEKSKLDSPGKTKRGECRSPSASPSNKFKIFDTDSSQSDSSPERRSQKKQDSSIDQSANSTKNRKSVWPEKSQSQPIPMGDQQEGHRLRSRSISTSQPHQPVENRPVIVFSRELDIPTCPLPNGMENEMSNEDTINSNLISLARQTRRKLYFADKSIVKSCASLSPCFTHRSKRHEEIIDGGKPSQLENMPEDLSSQEVDTIVTRGKQLQVQVDKLNLSPMIIMSPFSPPRRSHSDRKKVTGKSPNGPTPKRTQLTQKTLSPWKKSTEKSTLSRDMLDVLKLSRKESAENVKNSGTKSKPGRNQSTTKSKSSGEGSTTKLRSTGKDFPPKSPSPNKDFRSKSKSPGEESPSKSRSASKQSPTKSKPVGDESEPKSPSTQTGLGSKSPGKELSENGNLPPRPNGSPRRKSKLSPITPTPAKRRRVGADKIIAARAQVDSTIMTPRYNMRTRAQSVNGKND